MKTIGFIISKKENENRRAIIPEHIKLIAHPEMMYFESGYGNVLGYSDSDYENVGCNICKRNEALLCDIVCDPKVGDAEYLSELKEGQTIFGWVHATQNKDITDKIVNGKLSAYAWEKMFEKGRHVFWRNNELAGEAAVLHAFQSFGKMPYETDVAVIGKGNTARGAIKVLNMLGANVVQYDRHTEQLFRDEIGYYDVIVNCILWDVSRKDHIVYKSDLKRMKKGAMIIDVSCDKSGGIETSIPTSISNPVYSVDGVLHYVVDHTPSLFYKTFSKNNSEIIAPYVDSLIFEKENAVLKESLVISKGNIIDQEIMTFQNRLC